MEQTVSFHAKNRNGENRKLKKVEQTVSFHAKTETRNRKFAKREEILGGSRARIWSGPDFQKNGKLKNGKLKKSMQKCAKENARKT